MMDETYEDGQKKYIEIEIIGIPHFDTDCINNEKESNDGTELVQQTSKDSDTHESSVGNNVKIKKIDSKAYVTRPPKSEQVTNENLKNKNESLQIKKEIGVDDDKEKIVGNEKGVKEDLNIIKQEVDDGFQLRIDEDQYNIDSLKIKKEVDDCNEATTHIFEASKLRNHFEADSDTNIGLIIKTEIKEEPKPKDDIQCAVDSYVLNGNLKTKARVDELRLEQKRKCRSENAEHSEVPKCRSSPHIDTVPSRNVGIKSRDKASEDTYNCTKCLRKFDSFNRYVDHFFLHDIKLNTCPLCDTNFESVKPLCNHIRNIHIAKSFVLLRNDSSPEPEDEQKDTTKMFKCLVCENIVLKPHCFHHWEKHFNFKVPKRRLDVTSMNKSTDGRKVFSSKVLKKFKGMNDNEKDATIIDKGRQKSFQSTCVNSNSQKNIETDTDGNNERKSGADSKPIGTVDVSQDEDFEAEVEGNQRGKRGRYDLRHVDYKMKYYDADEDTDTVVVVLEEQYDDYLQRDSETMKELVNRKEYSCTMCDVMFWSLQKYVEHLGQQHTSSPNVCPKCAQVCLNMKHFYGHVRRHIINSFQRLNASEETSEKMSKMIKCAECYMMVEKSRGFAHWEAHLSIYVLNTFRGNKELSKKETPSNSASSPKS